MSSEEMTSSPKRKAEQADLANIHHPQPKRAKKPIFQEADDEEMSNFYRFRSPSSEQHGLSTILESVESSSPVLPSLLTTNTATREKSPSPDYRPDTISPLSAINTREKSPSPDYRPDTISPLSVMNTSQVIPSDVFAEYEQERKRDEAPREQSEEMVFNAIASFKAINNGRLSLTIYEMLRREVQESVYSKIPVSFSVKDTATSTAPAATYTSASVATQVEKRADTLTISSIVTNAAVEPVDNNTVTMAKASYSNAGTQTTPTIIAPLPPPPPPPPPPTVSAPAPAPAPAPVEPDWSSIYNKELDTIRMKKPFATGKDAITVKTKLRPIPKVARPHTPGRISQNRYASTSAPASRRFSTNASSTTARKTSAPTPSHSSAQVISLDDSDDDVPQRSTRTGGAHVSPSKVAKMQALTTVKLASGSSVRVPNDLTPASSTSSIRIRAAPTKRSPAAEPTLTSTDNTRLAPQETMLADEFDDVSSIGKEDPCRVGGGARVVNGVLVYTDEDGDHGFGGYSHNADDGYEAELEGHVGGHQDHPSPPQPRGDEPSFYGMTGLENQHQTDSLLRFQDRDFNAGWTPGPTTGTRLQFQQFLGAVGAKHMRNPEVKIRDHLEQAWGPRVTIDEVAAVEQNWCADPDKFVIAKGYPLVEDVDFIVHGNHAKPDGDCYWRAISFCLHGSDEHWALVKSEHLAYVDHVLKHPGHARHELYAEDLNKKFFKTSSATVDGTVMHQFYANMWQTLHMAHAWTPAFMQQVTADLYNIYAIMFTREDGTITETAVRGSFNARHIFIQFVDGNHFQPMTPNSYRPSEFRYPRVTVDKTAIYSNAPKATSNKTGLLHPWRNDFTKEVPAPVPRLSGCDVEGLRHWLGSK